jgi:hypothetical protein
MIIMREKKRGVGVKQPTRKKMKGSSLNLLGTSFGRREKTSWIRQI